MTTARADPPVSQLGASPPTPEDRSAGGRIRSAYHWVLSFYGRLDKARTFGLAAETAFWLFLSLMPLAAVGGLVAARLSLDNWQQVNPILSSLPPATRGLIGSELADMAQWNGGGVGVTGVVIFLWAASSGVHSMFDALELESKTERSWIKKRALALMTCVVLSLGVAFVALLGPGAEAVVKFLGSHAPSGSVLSGVIGLWGRLLRFVVGCCIAFGYVCFLYWIGVPPVARRERRIVPGALIAVAMQALLSIGYVQYVNHWGPGAAYGKGLAVVAITLTALYLVAIAILTGAIVNLPRDKADAEH